MIKWGIKGQIEYCNNDLHASINLVSDLINTNIVNFNVIIVVLNIELFHKSIEFFSFNLNQTTNHKLNKNIKFDTFTK